MKWLHKRHWPPLYSHMSGEIMSIAGFVKLKYIRYELSLGQDLPFGALFSGLQVSQASYLWSMEFWGTAGSRHIPIHRRIGIICVISIAISLAAVICPSSAILLIPRLAYWPAGSTDIWLKATFQDIWPNRSVLFFFFSRPYKAPWFADSRIVPTAFLCQRVAYFGTDWHTTLIALLATGRPFKRIWTMLLIRFPRASKTTVDP